MIEEWRIFLHAGGNRAPGSAWLDVSAADRVPKRIALRGERGKALWCAHVLFPRFGDRDELRHCAETGGERMLYIARERAALGAIVPL